MSITNLNSNRVKLMIEENQFDLIIDLRTEDNYEKGHLYGAINIPINQIPDEMDFLSNYKDKKILLYCGIGSQSKSTCKVLAVNGFEHLYSLYKGIKEYKYSLEY